MKKTIITTLMVAGSTVLFAQTIDEAKKHLYYGREASARATLQAIIQKDPGQNEARYWLTQTGPAANVLYSTPLAVQDQPWYAAAYGAQLLQQGKADSATIYFDRALKATKEKDAAILEAVARPHIESKNGNAEYAIALLDKAIKRDKNNALLYWLKGNAYRKLNNGTEAYKAYREALEKNANLAAAHHSIGNIFLTQNNPSLYLEHYNNAIAADAAYAPAYRSLYTHYFYNDAARALQFFNQYKALADADIANDYAYTDLLYLNRNYEEAVRQAEALLGRAPVQPRLYKLLAYSREGLKDTAAAISYMNRYLSAADTSIISKDYEALGSWYAATPGREDSALLLYTKAMALEKDSSTLRQYFKKMAGLAGKKNDFATQAAWMGRYYENNDRATNVDLFNWALAHYRASQYAEADSVFGLYVQKYPEQGFGYYWQARSNVARDPEMTQGLAVPHYQKLIEVLTKDSSDANTKKWLVESYAYLAAYETNTEKDYSEAIDYFEKVLEVDPANEDAKKYIDVLEKRMASK